jgi:hypothetical protein
VTVAVGDTVRWTQRDSISHTTTSDTSLWNSGLLGLNQTFTRVFDAPGTFRYHCIPHPSMRGTVIVSAPATNRPPEVAIVSPTNGFIAAVGASILVEATATDGDGQVVQVEFFDGASALGSDAASPYSISATLGPGGHVLTAVATDNEGGKTTSADVNIHVATVPIADPIPERIGKGAFAIELRVVATGLNSPLGMAAPDDGSGRVFVYDQAGYVWGLTDAGLLAEPLLDIRDRLMPLGAYDERGLLGLAAHPNFAQQPLLYTYTSEPTAGPADFPTMLASGVTNNHQSVIAEWRIDASNTNRVDPASRREVMRIDQPQANHNGGTMRFGPDGFLYVALGDGGQADDQGNGHLPGGNGQDVEMTVLAPCAKSNGYLRGG